MVFSSIPVYLDPPNWHQQPNLPLGSGSNNNHEQLPPLLPRPPFGSQVNGGPTDHGSGGISGVAGTIKPNSMADRARMAKIPHPEIALKCPRCESTNTKFCYFNNYSLSQPRYFCKTCRRYWTQGGALRNVPVGGCRRNKKSKTSSSRQSMSPVSTSSIENNNNPSGLINQFSQPGAHSLTFLDSMQNLSSYGGGSMGLSSFNEMQQAQANRNEEMNFQIGGGTNLMGMDQWRSMQQIPFLGSSNGFESSTTTGLYQFQNASDGVGQESQLIRTSDSRVATTSDQVPPVKVEDHNHGHGVSLTRPFLGVSVNNGKNNNDDDDGNNNNQMWGGNAWTDLQDPRNNVQVTVTIELQEALQKYHFVDG